MTFNPAFTKNELRDFLIKRGVEVDDARKLEEEKVDGETFQDITETDLKDIGVKLGTRKKIMKIIHTFQQSALQNAELQDIQILGGDSTLSNSIVFDLITAGTSCTVIPSVTPTVTSTTSLAPTISKSPPASSTSSKRIDVFQKQTSKYKKKCTLPSFLAEMLPESENTTNVSDDEGPSVEDASGHTPSTYSDPEDINVLAMLGAHMTGKTILSNLKGGKGISRTDVNEIVRIVVRSMVDDLRTLYPASTQKLNLAKAVVRDLPELKSNREGVDGYEHFYDPRTNSGSIEWRLKTMRLKIPASKKKYFRRKNIESKEMNKETETEIVIDEETLKKIDWLKSQPATESNKEEIFEAMKETFHIRRSFITKANPPVADTLKEFPKLKEFDGALIDADFKLIHPNAANLLEVLPDYSEKIRIYVTQNRLDILERVGQISDANLKAMMYLADLLPLPLSMKKRKLGDGERHPSEGLILFSEQQDKTLPIDDCPRLFCCGDKKDEQLQFFLILDKEYIDLGKCFIRAFDILYKSFKVFNVNYPVNLAIFYSFLDTMIYKVNTGVARSSCEHLHNILCCVQIPTTNL